jgi:hypothetical protein
VALSPPASQKGSVNMAERKRKLATPDAAATKEAPPERPQDVRLRTIVILSFWALIVFVGVPMWWQTTSIHRAQLPLPEMLRWADGQVGEHSNCKTAD